MEEERSTSRTPLIVFLVLVVVLVAAGFLLFRGYFLDKEGEPVETAIAASPTPEPSPTPTLQERLSARLSGVTLATSDVAIRPLIAELSSHPKVAEWLVNEDLVRRFVAAVANIADGVSPKSHFDFLAPGKPFKVITEDDVTRVDPDSYRRYDLAALVFDSLDTTGTVTLYRELQPLIDDAFAEISPRGRRFDDTLDEAISELLEVPEIAKSPKLQPLVVTYEYADTRFEELTEAQRQLLRMGPENVRIVQQKLAEIRDELASGPTESIVTSGQ